MDPRRKVREELEPRANGLGRKRVGCGEESFAVGGIHEVSWAKQLQIQDWPVDQAGDKNLGVIVPEMQS